MNSKGDIVEVRIKYKNIEKTFSGNIENVWSAINKFFHEFIPTFEIANKLMLKVDLQRLTKDCESLIAFSKDGPSLLVSRNKLTDNETLGLWLLAHYVGSQVGILTGDAVPKNELQARLGKDSKITSTRLGELVKNQIATRTADDKYRITTLGIVQIQKEILPRIKARTKT